MHEIPDLASLLWVVATAACCSRGLWVFASAACGQSRSIMPLVYKAVALFCLYQALSTGADAALFLAAGFGIFCVIFLGGGLVARRRRLGYMTHRVAGAACLQSDAMPFRSLPRVGSSDR